MTREQAQRQAVKRWGKRAYIRAENGLSSPEARAAASERWASTSTELEAVEKELANRLKACDWYQELTGKIRNLRKAKSEQGWFRHYYKFAVGELHIGFHVEGQGDTWEEAFAQADAKRTKVSA